jgi:peptidoglycan-associated lipoprotein
MSAHLRQKIGRLLLLIRSRNTFQDQLIIAVVSGFPRNDICCQLNQRSGTMKNLTTGNTLILSLLGLLLVAGCAKQPNAPLVAVTEPPPATEPMTMTPPASPVMQPATEPAPVMQAEMPMVELVRIQFAFDQASLSPEARETLAANAAGLKTNSALQVNIEGHCDNRGSDEYNLALGERRAMAAKDYLVSLGVAAERLEVISYGEEQPLDAANNEMAWAKNRRAEFKPLN